MEQLNIKTISKIEWFDEKIEKNFEYLPTDKKVFFNLITLEKSGVYFRNDFLFNSLDVFLMRYKHIKIINGIFYIKHKVSIQFSSGMVENIYFETKEESLDFYEKIVSSESFDGINIK